MIPLERFNASLYSAGWYIVLVVIVPLVSLALAGLWSLWRNAQLLPVLAVWLLVTAVSWFFLILLPRRRLRREIALASHEAGLPGNTAPVDDKARDASLPDQLDVRDDWSERDHAVWQQAVIEIDRLLEDEPNWQSLPDYAFEILEFVSIAYHGESKQARYRFTLPEALLVTAETSERYRSLLLDHLPFVNSIRLGTLMNVYARQRDIRSGIRWVNNARRIIRLGNPMAAALGELRDHLSGEFLGQLGDHIQTDLKRLMLQEVAQVGIDLYSGRLKRSRTELERYRSRAFQEDASRLATAVEPLRIVVVGQTSSGKSSLVNAILDRLAAETDRLPSTEQVTVHAFSHASVDRSIRLVDTPGLDGEQSRLDDVLDIVTDADLVLHVVKADTSAREPDRALHEAVSTWFLEHPARRRAPTLLVLSHIDRLPPRNEWQPPYDLDDRNDRKSRTIALALDSARRAIGFDDDAASVPVCLDPQRGLYNIDVLGDALLAQADTASLAQLNRRRIESGAAGSDWRQHWQKLQRLGRVSGQFLFDSLRPRSSNRDSDSPSSADDADRHS